MEEYRFEDVLAQAYVTCSFPGLEAVRTTHDNEVPECTSLFFPGCSFINYGLPLVQATYELLEKAGQVDGMSLLCCGKILAYEPGGDAARLSFEEQFCDHIAETSVKRIVAACPNCVGALRPFLGADERTADIEVVPLTTVLVDRGYRLDPQTAFDVARRDHRLTEADQIIFSVKDSCPDRETGEFATGLRTLMGDVPWVDPAHCRNRSICCGSRPRAAGKMEGAITSCELNHSEGRAAGANAMVTPCMSCTYLLSTLVRDLPVYHYLELLFDYRIPWDTADEYMKLRFLFDGSSGVREFYGLDTI